MNLNCNDEILKNNGLTLNLDILEISGLLHDLGHPPFGHNGEKALNECMKGYGGFEGNAQTLRILTKIEKKFKSNESNEVGVSTNGDDERFGLNLTYRTIASVLKYDDLIEENYNGEVKKGYYDSEKEIVEEIRDYLKCSETEKLKTIECNIMDLADDIAYSTYDLEDVLKAGFLNPLDIINSDILLLEEISVKVNEKNIVTITYAEVLSILISIFSEIFKRENDVYRFDSFIDYIVEYKKIYNAIKILGDDGYIRTQFTSSLVSKYVNNISIDKTSFDINKPWFAKVSLNEELYKQIEVIKHFTYLTIINSPMLKVSEYRGFQIVKEIFRVIEGNINFLPRDYQQLYNSFNKKSEKKRVIWGSLPIASKSSCVYKTNAYM